MENNRRKIELEKMEIALYMEDRGTQRIQITDEDSERHMRERNSRQEERKEDTLADASDCTREKDFFCIQADGTQNVHQTNTDVGLVCHARTCSELFGQIAMLANRHLHQQDIYCTFYNLANFN